MNALERRVNSIEEQIDIHKPRPKPNLIDDGFSAQASFIRDESSLVIGFCTRRAGKSYAAGLRLFQAALAHPGSSCLYIALTRDSAKKIAWKDVLKTINRKHDLGCKFNGTELSCTLPNGSTIYLLGVDSDEQEKQKLLGQKYSIVIIDEAASFSIDLNELVFGILKPAVADYRGTICLIGTPGNLKKGLFFDLTSGETKSHWSRNGWSCHQWTAFDNPYMSANWKAEINELKANNPRVEETPLFKQHYLGQWVVDDSKLVYRYLAGRNDFNGALPARVGEYRYVLGIDLGYENATAWTVGAYHEHDKDLYVLESFKESRLDISAVALRTTALCRKYDFDRIQIDNANKQAVEEMRKRHGIPLHAADKTGKSDFIELMNAEFIMGRIKIGPDAHPLKDEYVGLVWDEKTDKRQEHPSCDNHCADSALYMWRYCYSYLSEVVVPKPAEGTPAWVQEQVEQMKQDEIQRLESNKSQELEDSGWDSLIQ